MADFYIKQNDTSPAIKMTLLDSDNKAIDLTDATVKFHMVDSEGVVKVNDSADIVGDPFNGVVKYEWKGNGETGDTITVGNYKAEWEVTYSDSTIETFPNDGDIVIRIVKELA